MEMYKIVIILLLCLTGKAIAQPSQYTPMTANGYQMKRVKVDSTLHIPSFCGVPTLNGSTSPMGALAYDTCNNVLYKHNTEFGWTVVGGGAGTTPTLQQVLNSGSTLTNNDTITAANRLRIVSNGVGTSRASFFNIDTNQINLNVVGSTGLVNKISAQNGAVITQEQTSVSTSSVTAVSTEAKMEFIKTSSFPFLRNILKVDSSGFSFLRGSLSQVGYTFPLGQGTTGQILKLTSPTQIEWANDSSGGGGGSTDTTSLSNRINQAFTNVTKLTDTSFFMSSPSGTNDTIKLNSAPVYVESPIMARVSGDSNIIYFNADTANAWRGGGVAVDTIFRTLGKDSIFYKKNNITYAIKDSVGGGLSTVYQNEIHVSKDGSDVTGDGTLLKPYATITQGLTLVAGTRKTIVLHPGSYSESPNITVQYTVITTFELLGGNTEIVGTVSTNKGCTISGIKMTNLTISNLTGTGNVNVLNCDISGTLTKSSTGDYTLIRFCDIGTTSITSSAGTVAIFGGNPNFITVNNAGARVVVKNCTTVAPVLTAGSLSLVDCIIFAITGTSNAYTAAAGTFSTLANSQLIVPTFTNFARVSIAGFYSIINTIYDRASSTLTGTSTNSIVNSQFINADKFIKQGGTSSQFLKADGSVDSSTYLSASDTISLSTRINTKFSTTDTSLLQQKLLPANSIVGNATFQQANAQSIFFKDTSGSYTGTITWNGTAPTSGTFTYRWVRLGKKVDLNITLVYTAAGTSNSTLLLTLPSDAPTPIPPTGLTANSVYVFPVVAKVNAGSTTLTNAGERAAMRKNSGGTGFEINVNFTSQSAAIAYIQTTYYTN